MSWRLRLQKLAVSPTMRGRSSSGTCVHVFILLYVSSYYYICDLMLLYMCPHTAATCGLLRASRSLQAIGELPTAY